VIKKHIITKTSAAEIEPRIDRKQTFGNVETECIRNTRRRIGVAVQIGVAAGKLWRTGIAGRSFKSDLVSPGGQTVKDIRTVRIAGGCSVDGYLSIAGAGKVDDNTIETRLTGVLYSIFVKVVPNEISYFCRI